MEMPSCSKYPFSHIWVWKHWNVNGFVHNVGNAVWKRAIINNIGLVKLRKQFFIGQIAIPTVVHGRRARHPGGERYVNKQQRRQAVSSRGFVQHRAKQM